MISMPPKRPCACARLCNYAQTMDWESLKYFAALGQAGSLSAAGKALGVRHSTVLRRIAALEAELGRALVERRSDGYGLTSEGQALLADLGPVEAQLVALSRRLSGRDLRLSGEVRIASVAVLTPLLADALSLLRARHPGILVNVSAAPTLVSLARHETDIALRITASPPEALVGRRIAEVAHGVYGAQGLDGETADWIAYDARRADLPQAVWVEREAGRERIAFRTNNTMAMIEMVRAGLGMAVLPCFAADGIAGLVRYRMTPDLGLGLWHLVHPDLRHTPKVRAALDAIWEALSARRAAFEAR